MSLDELRDQIDQIDEEMVALFKKRLEVATGIAMAKKEQNLAVLDQQREQKVMQRVIDMAGDEFDMYIKMFYSSIFDLSRGYQTQKLQRTTKLTEQIKSAAAEMKMEFPKKATVACQGVLGAYQQQAAEKLFPLGNMMYFDSFASVFQAVQQGLCQYGILPVENSTAGSVTEVYDLMEKNKFYIVRTLKLPINHALLMKQEMDMSQVKEIVSHEQALSQCSEFLRKHSDIKVTMFENTASAAKYVAESGRDDIAAISSPQCAHLYGLKIVERDIQNNTNNYTRFICISKKMEVYTDANRISLMLSVSHQPGALHNMIGKISSHGLNLSKLESRPIGGKDFEFRFYFDIDATVFSDEIIALLADMENSADQFTFLGCYNEG